MKNRKNAITGRRFNDAFEKYKLPILLCAAFTVILIGCGNRNESAGPKYGTAPANVVTVNYVFAVHPLHNPAKLFEAYQPMVDYLNQNITGAHFVLEASRDYAAFEEKYQARQPDLILPNPWQTLQAIEKGYEVIAMAGEPQDFKGIFIARKDSPVQQPADLKGKSVSYPSPTALAACIMPQYYLYEHGIDINHDIENKYVGSQESSIMNAYLGLTAVGVTWPPPWQLFQHDHPEEAAQLKVLWETEALINNSVMARDDVPLGVRNQVQNLLAALQKTGEGRKILAGMDTARFIPANNSDYDVVKAFISNFEKRVRPIEVP